MIDGAATNAIEVSVWAAAISATRAPRILTGRATA